MFLTQLVKVRKCMYVILLNGLINPMNERQNIETIFHNNSCDMTIQTQWGHFKVRCQRELSMYVFTYQKCTRSNHTYNISMNNNQRSTIKSNINSNSSQNEGDYMLTDKLCQNLNSLTLVFQSHANRYGIEWAQKQCTTYVRYLFIL